MMKKLQTLWLAVVLSMFASAGFAQFGKSDGGPELEEEKATSLYVFKENDLSVDKAGDGDVVNRAFYWGQEEFADDNVTVLRDDSTFKSITFKVKRPMVENHYGVKFTHKERELGFDLLIEADKKDYKYRFDHFTYKAKEVDRKGNVVPYEGTLEAFKGAAKKGLIEELDLMLNTLVDSMKVDLEVEMTEAQEESMEKWQEEQEAAREAAEEAAEQAAKEAEKARKEAEKEAARKAKEEAAAARDAERAKRDAEKEAEKAKREEEMKKAKEAKEAEQKKDE